MTATVSAAQAQTAPTPDAGVAARIHFSHLGIEDGLSSARTIAVVQDPTGYLWVGTSNGLDRYDGYTVKAYRNDPLDPDSLSASGIQTLYVDRDGRLWAGTSAGVDVYDPARDRFRREPGLSGKVVSAISQDSSGLMWFGTRGSGVYTFDPQSRRLTNYVHNGADPRSLSSNAVQKIVEDHAGTVWIGTFAGLARFDPSTGGFTTYRHDDLDPRSLSYNVVWDILEDQSGTLWVGTDGGGLDAMDVDRDRFVHYRHDPDNANTLSDDRIGCLTEAPGGALVVGTFTAGVSVLDARRQTFTVARHQDRDSASLVNDTVFGCATDRSGLVWIATPGGLDSFDPLRQVVTLYRSDILTSDNVTAVYEDTHGRLWVGSIDQGLDVVDRQTGHVTHYPADATGTGLANPFVYALAADRDGAMWVGTLGGGLYRLDPERNTFTAYRHDPGDPGSLSDDAINDLLVGRDGAIWISTRGGGLNRLAPDTHTFTAYRHDPADPASLSNDVVRALAEDADGNIWVGTNGGGLDRLTPDGGAITHFRHNPADGASLAEDNISALLVDRSGAVWVGFQGSGLDRYQPARGAFMHYREKDGLASDEVVSIVEDGPPTDATRGNLWIATGRGLSRLDVDRQSFRTLGPDAGLPAAFTKARAVSQSGNLLFGSFDGLVELDSRRLVDDAYVPPIVFTDFLLANQHVPVTPDGPLTKPLDLSDAVRLDWGQHVISLEFAALSFRTPSANRYRYLLEGFDSHWTEVDSTRRLVTYTNLDPGTYTFRVTGSNASGVWNPTGRSLTLVIAPPWWATWWFRALFVTLLTGVLAAMYVWRVRALQARQLQLEALVAQRTQDLLLALGTRDTFLRTLAHDLKAPLVALGWHVQALTGHMRDGSIEPPVLVNGLQSIAESATQVITAIDELHDLTRLEAGAPVPLQRERVDLPALVQQLVDNRNASGRAHFHLETSTPGLTVDADRARLARVLDNLFDNAIKYGHPETEVRVSIDRVRREGREWASIRVQDSGIGIPAADLPHVFERYHRGSNVAQIPGEGLGLASVRQLTELHGGTVEVDSAEGVGTTFTINLPLSPSDDVEEWWSGTRREPEQSVSTPQP